MRDCLLLFHGKGERQRLHFSDCHISGSTRMFRMYEVLVLAGVGFLHTNTSLPLTLIVKLYQYRECSVA